MKLILNIILNMTYVYGRHWSFLSKRISKLDGIFWIIICVSKIVIHSLAEKSRNISSLSKITLWSLNDFLVHSKNYLHYCACLNYDVIHIIMDNILIDKLKVWNINLTKQNHSRWGINIMFCIFFLNSYTIIIKINEIMFKSHGKVKK